MQMELARKVHFESSHRYYREDWSREQNFAVFGACANEHGHGHTYALEAYFTGPIDHDTGMIANLKDVDDLLKKVVAHLDQKNLNQLEDFKKEIPTTEILAQFLWDELLTAQTGSNLPGEVKLSRIKLFESENLWVEIANG